VRRVGVMPYCGRCLNVGRAAKRGAPPESGPVQPRLQCATSSGSTDSERGQHAICGKPALLDIISREYLAAGSGEKFRRINTAFSPRQNAPGDQLAPDGRRDGTAAPTLDAHGEEL
jgi:hypothetical protein